MCGLSTESSLQAKIRENLGAFSGFPFTADSVEYQKKKAELEK